MSRLSLPKIIRILSLFAITLFITFLSQSKPSTTYAATCYSGECKSPKYACQNNTMCCTGGGCPSWICVQSGCSYSSGSCWQTVCKTCLVQDGCYKSGYWHKHCTYCSYHYHYGYYYNCSKKSCSECGSYKTKCTAEPVKTGGTCGWCTGNDPGNGGGGGGWPWGFKIAAAAFNQTKGVGGNK